MFVSRGRYTQEFRGALAWMEKHVLPNGKAGYADYAPDHYMSWDASAMLFLACVHEVDDDGERRKRIGRLLERMVTFAVNCQTSRGGWTFAPKQGGGYEDHSHSATGVGATPITVPPTHRPGAGDAPTR